MENYANLQAEDYRLDCRQVRDYLALFSRQLLSLEQQELPEEIGAAPADAEAAEVPATLPANISVPGRMSFCCWTGFGLFPKL